MAHNMTVTVEDPLWKDMKKHSEIRWSVVMKDAVKEKIRALEVLNKLMKKSKLSEKEINKFAVNLGKKINR
jgi:tRNA A37 threonylcarbamoyladenosine modification protein TsaB